VAAAATSTAPVEDQRQQAEVPLRASLRGRDDIARIGVREHDQQARSPGRQPMPQRIAPRQSAIRRAVHKNSASPVN
jgi:hypothetical protein